MKPVIRWPSARTRSQLLSRKSYKPDRVIRIQPVKLRFTFRPAGFGQKPKIETYEYATD